METKAAAGYVLNKAEASFTINTTNTGKPETVLAGNFANYKGSAELKKVTEDNKALEGAIFKVVNDKDEDIITNLSTDKEGKVLAENLAPGTYAFVETAAPAGYVLNPIKTTFTINDSNVDKPAVVAAGEVINYKGSAELTKVDAKGNALENAEFKVIDSEGSTVVEKLTTNADGKITVANLAPGKYTFVETKAPTGYVLNTDTVEFTIEAEQAAMPKVVNAGELANYKASAVLTKVDAIGKVLENAEFKVVDADGKTIADKLVTDASGKITVDNLSPGKYQFVETKAPTGYILNTNPVGFTIEAEQAAVPEVVNAGELVNYQGMASFIKVDENNMPLPDAEFELIDTNSGEVVKSGLISDEKGRVSASDLAPGNYAFKETKAPKGFVKSEKLLTFTIINESDTFVSLDLGIFINKAEEETVIIPPVKPDKPGEPGKPGNPSNPGNPVKPGTTWTPTPNGSIKPDGPSESVLIPNQPTSLPTTGDNPMDRLFVVLGMFVTMMSAFMLKRRPKKNF
ncbi:MSCRAMM family protein [Brochothrix thermosphacta]|uniref:MSCRAMM family protein n=1 Tax=Brochothrix thermosphacta TaxID=2756 RepID=UPI00083F5996|nr:SpaA isopeptide-forming pilin-related protein [Brochothrix thermosphacta]ODJ62083.1 hypothetical protein BFR35_11810 [Brochothrix thermosphacta]